MHPKKAESLASCERAASMCDATIRNALHIIGHPAQYTVWGALGTAAVLPLMGLNLVLVDLSWVLVARTPDETWQRGFPTPPDSGADLDPTT